MMKVQKKSTFKKGLNEETRKYTQELKKIEEEKNGKRRFAKSKNGIRKKRFARKRRNERTRQM